MNSPGSSVSHRRQTRSKVAAQDKCRSRKSRGEKIDEFQPKILRKPESFKSESEKKSSEIQSVEKLPTMITSAKLVTRNQADVPSLLPFLDMANSNFYVVGVIGMKDSGKTAIMNLLATGDYRRCGIGNKSLVQGQPFGDSQNAGVEAFITEARVVLLDSAPLFYNENGGCEFIRSDSNDIRRVQMLLELCHELLVVYENNQIMNLTRILICAKKMISDYDCNEPVITLIENRKRPGSCNSPLTEIVLKYLSREVSESVNSIQFPDISQVAASHHDDPEEIASQLCDDINTRKELKSFNEPAETEKSWWEKFSKLNLAGGPLVARFETLRGKFYQSIEEQSLGKV